MVGGLLSLNPAMFTKGAVERGFKEYIKFLNDPNRAVANMFEKLDIDTSKSFIPKSSTAKTLYNPAVNIPVKSTNVGSKVKISTPPKPIPQGNAEMGTYKLTKNPITKRVEPTGQYRKPNIPFYPILKKKK